MKQASAIFLALMAAAAVAGPASAMPRGACWAKPLAVPPISTRILTARWPTSSRLPQKRRPRRNLKTSDLHAGLGLAGIVTSVGAERIAEAKLPFASVIADNDAYAACVGAFAGGDGGIVIAGTGSIGFASINGVRHMVGGWGFALGDHGSGAWLGHHAVRRAALAIDGLLQPTPLIEEVLSRVGRTRFDVSRWSEQATPKDYAEMAPLVFECAAKGDVVGMTIVIEGAAAISNLGRALLARGAGKLCLLGGVSKVYPPYLDADVKQALAAPGADAMDGAIMMARQAQGFSVSWA